jgi:hypothetical protein
MTHPFIWHYLLIAPHVLLLAVLVALLRNKIYKQFPIFFAFIVQEIVQSMVMIPLIESHTVSAKNYHIAYTVTLILTTAFYFGIIHELFGHMFRNYPALNRFGRPLFGWLTIGLLIITLCLAAYTGVYANQLTFVAYLFDRTAGILQAGLLICLFVFSSQLGLSLRGHVFGIAFGQGIVASAGLIASAISSHTGFAFVVPADYFVMAVYHVCVLIWIFYLFAPEKSYAPATLPQHDLDIWKLELERLLKQ